jgi:hypothetical protein
VKEKPTVGSPYFGAFLLTASVGRLRSSMYISLFSASIHKNYTSDFLLIIVVNSFGIFEAIEYKHLKIIANEYSKINSHR